ncbi:hypothetical protein LX99_00398 [Mucilaginibacter oryzae]|uniref:DUF2281 domain-containing protein n=1 Tax=Mucilaginibacter oryzae TaxID=468058 RepID=A0A316HHU3_9SPHI|nr:hypothetical protein [Mucilaginibacter oryzae]PWK79937.1 hypothetical protein LX99_00398 [Mucilaginibacter oryzae]
MTTTELKTEINKTLENIPEEALNDVLLYLQHLQAKAPSDIKLTSHLRQILTEDAELLEKLAQ